MAKYTLADLTDRLFKTMDRLLDSDLEGEDLQLEIKRANAVGNVAREIVNTQKLVLDAYRTAAELEQSEVVTVVAGKKPKRLEGGDRVILAPEPEETDAAVA
jgi:hypothetical protein